VAALGDREDRASEAIQALASMGKVILPMEASWKAELLGQLTRFPAGRYDDGVDVCSRIGRGLEMMAIPAAISPGARPCMSRHKFEWSPHQVLQ
jgi:phage terminase large subunit-like protein